MASNLLLILAMALSAAAQSLKEDPLVDASLYAPQAVLDVRYASERNILKRAVYPKAKVYLRRSVAQRMAVAADKLRKQGYLMKLFDGYRPLSVQKQLWDAFADPKYVADPKRGSAHNRGAAVDLGLVRLDGSEVPMPSEFDAFGPQARYDAPQATAAQRKHARILRRAMKDAGFIPLDEEWWHFSDPRAKDWPVLNIPFEDLP